MAPPLALQQLPPCREPATDRASCSQPRSRGCSLVARSRAAWPCPASAAPASGSPRPAPAGRSSGSRRQRCRSSRKGRPPGGRDLEQGRGRKFSALPKPHGSRAWDASEPSASCSPARHSRDPAAWPGLLWSSARLGARTGTLPMGVWGRSLWPRGQRARLEGELGARSGSWASLPRGVLVLGSALCPHGREEVLLGEPGRDGEGAVLCSPMGQIASSPPSSCGPLLPPPGAQPLHLPCQGRTVLPSLARCRGPGSGRGHWLIWGESSWGHICTAGHREGLYRVGEFGGHPSRKGQQMWVGELCGRAGHGANCPGMGQGPHPRMSPVHIWPAPPGLAPFCVGGVSPCSLLRGTPSPALTPALNASARLMGPFLIQPSRGAPGRRIPCGSLPESPATPLPLPGHWVWGRCPGAGCDGLGAEAPGSHPALGAGLGCWGPGRVKGGWGVGPGL